jgi:hypothetical protein
MSKIPNDCICLFYFQVGWEGGGVVWGIHEKHKFKYFKNLTVKVCKIWCNDVYMSILQCDIFWWKFIDRNFFNPISNSYYWHSGCPKYQMTAFVFFIFRSAGKGEGWFEGDSTWLIHYKKKHKKQTTTQLYNLVQWCLYVYSSVWHFLVEIHRQEFF